MQRITKLIIKRHQEVDAQRLGAKDVERLESMFVAMNSGDSRARPSNRQPALTYPKRIAATPPPNPR